MSNTEIEYSEIISNCFEIFSKKNSDYGTSWKILRLPSITDQIFIKAQRIRTIQENGFSKVEEGQIPEFIGIINYCVMALILISEDNTSDDLSDLQLAYNVQISEVRELLFNKNHDYGEAWRDMSQESFADLILMKLMRIKQILGNDGKTLISEGIDANYVDILNYSVFALILISEGKH